MKYFSCSFVNDFNLFIDFHIIFCYYIPNAPFHFLLSSFESPTTYLFQHIKPLNSQNQAQYLIFTKNLNKRMTMLHKIHIQNKAQYSNFYKALSCKINQSVIFFYIKYKQNITPVPSYSSFNAVQEICSLSRITQNKYINQSYSYFIHKRFSSNSRVFSLDVTSIFIRLIDKYHI